MANKIRDAIYILETRRDIGDQPVDWDNKAYRVAYTTEDLQHEMDAPDSLMGDALAYKVFHKSEVYDTKEGATAYAKRLSQTRPPTFYGICHLDMGVYGFPVSANMVGWG